LSVLDQLYESLVSNRQPASGELKLLSALGSGSQIGQFYATIVNDSSFLILNAGIDYPDPKTRITVSGTTSAIGFANASFSLVFTIDELEMLRGDMSTGVTDPGSTWRYDAIPWIGLSKPSIELTAYDDAGIPVFGKFGMVTLLGTFPVTLLAEFPPVGDNWLYVAQPPTDTINIINVLQYAGGINLMQLLPPGLNLAANLSLQQLTFAYNPADQTLSSIQITVGSSKSWLLFGSISVDKPTIDIAIANPADLKNRAITYSVGGQILIGLDGNPDHAGIIDVGASYPNLSLYANLGEASPAIPLGKFIEAFTPGTVLDLNAELNAFRMNLTFPTGGVAYEIAAGLTAVWPVVIDNETIFTITELSFNLNGKGNKSPFGSISGTVAIGPKDNPVHVRVTASYQSVDVGWVFTGETLDKISLGKLASTYLGIDIEQDYAITGIKISIAPKTGDWSIAGRTAEEWKMPFVPDVGITASVEISYDPVTLYSGLLSGSVRYKSIEVDLSYAIKAGSFTLHWGMLSASIQNKVASFHLQGVTLGGMIEKAVTWATGTSFGLASPWNVLDEIPLDNIALIFDFNTNQVSFGLEIHNLDFGFAKISGISVTYVSPKVNIELDGSFIWQQGPLGWDAADPASTPAPPGGGSKYFDLRLLVLGQHVAIKGQEPFKTVEEAIKLLRDLPDTPPLSRNTPAALRSGTEYAAKAAVPSTKADGQSVELVYDPNAGWLAATDFGILRVDPPKTVSAGTPAGLLEPTKPPDYFLSLSVIFSDPNLYALRAALSGPAAKVLTGLVFEIMYQRVTDTVGVYQAEITLPTAMRSLDVGAYSVTLPVFGIAIYTNGDFKVDIGFPWNQDFSRSFTVQGIVYPGIPVIGSAGFYFGKLSSATSNQVPKTNKGYFNPVLVFGFGLRVGVGKEIEKGPLKAGFSVTVFGIIEGVIARWNPNVPAVSSSNQLQDNYYFWLQGTIGILGKLYGSIDFAIIKADVSLTVTIAAQITFESYRDIPITVWAAVDIKVSIKIDLGLFSFKISFSFSATIKETFTIKNTGKAPWDPDQLLEESPLARRNRRLRVVRDGEWSELGDPTFFKMKWANLLAAEAKTRLTTYLLPVLTVHGDGAASPADQQTAYVLLLALESVSDLPPDGQEAEEDTAFEQLCKQIFRWVAAAGLSGGPYTAEQVDQQVLTDDLLCAIMDNLTGKKADPQGVIPISPIPFAAIDDFMTGQFFLSVSASPPDGNGQTMEKHTTLFPMVPALQLTVPDPQDSGKPPLLQYQFSEFNRLSEDYLRNLASYFDKLAVQVQRENQPPAALKRLAEEQDQSSMASFVFADYFLLIARQMVQAARDALRNYQYPIDPALTVEGILEDLKKGGADYTAFCLFEANSDHQLTVQKTVWIPGVSFLVQSGQTLDDIVAKAFGNAFGVLELASFGGTESIANADSKALLLPGQTVTYTPTQGDPVQRKLQPGDTLNGLARLFGCNDLGDFLAKSNVSTQPVLQPLAMLHIPTFAYATAVGDTLSRLVQLYGVSLKRLASDDRNVKIAGLFNSRQSNYLNIAHLKGLQAGRLLNEIKTTHGLRRTAGMASRFFLHGLRLPTSGITPLQPCMCCIGGADQPTLASECGLYALTGQQFAVPPLADADTFAFSLDNPAGIPWVSLSGGEEEGI
jgi:hypothetical protein